MPRSVSHRTAPEAVMALRRTALLALVTALAGATPPGLSAQSPVSTTAELTYLTKYYFAGIPFAADDVTQLRVSAATGSFTVNGFAVLDHTTDGFTEFDVYADYYRQLAPELGFFIGAALYNFDLGTQWEATPELYGGLALTMPLNPTLYVAHDFDLGDGTHAALMLSQSVPVATSGLTVDLAGNLDYNDGYYLDFSGFGYADLSASVGIPVGPVTLSPIFRLQFSLDDEFKAQTGLDDVEEVFGVSASATF